MITDLTLGISFIIFLAIICQWIAWRKKLPPILFLLLGGITIGPVLGLLDPEALFGDLLFPAVSLSVAVILFEGSLTLKFRDLQGVQGVVQYLVTIGAFWHFLIASVASHFLIGLEWKLAFVFAALTVVTGPTVIVPLLRSVRPTAKVSNILRWEGIVIDPLGALLVVMVYEFMVVDVQSDALSSSITVFFKLLCVGSVLGGLAGWMLGVVLRRHWLPEYLHNLATLATVISLFSVSNVIEHESGLLAVTVMGIWLANMPRVHVEEILNFKENLSVLFISALFIVLAARVDLSDLATFGLPLLGLLAVIQFVSRPVGVFFSTLNSPLTWNERALLAWIAPRGIVAAAISALFAIKLTEDGIPEASYLVPLTFSVIIGTVVWQSLTSHWVAKWLGVSEPEPKGFLMIGANPVARAIADLLKQHDYRVLLVDTNWEHIRASRMAGLEVFYGNPISEYADRRLDLVGLGKMLAISPQRDLSVLATWRYRHEFGRNNIFSLQTIEEISTSEKHQVSEDRKGKVLFAGDVTYSSLLKKLNAGAQIKKTKLSESFTFGDLKDKHGEEYLPLFAVDPQEHMHIFVKDGQLNPGPGWVILALTVSEPKPMPESKGVSESKTSESKTMSESKNMPGSNQGS